MCQSVDPRDKRLRTSALVSIGEINLVIDSGPDFRQQMLREGIERVDAILITHEHNDHVIGLDDVRPFNFIYRRDMEVFATSHVNQELRMRFPYVFAANKYPGAPMVKLIDIKAEEKFFAAGIEIEPIQVMHGKMPVLGFKFGPLVYLTDVKTIAEEEIEKIRNCETLVINALHHEPHYSHLNLQEALEMIKKINPGKAYLTHISHHMGLHAKVETTLPENVFLGYDGLRIGL
ncbi:MAG: MBL fold metallo-hydrolase [Saprospiraceae bacterium]